jgi:SAM-dependent methyltransferase
MKGPDNQAIFDANWQLWIDMKIHGPASRWLRWLIGSQIRRIPHPDKIRSVLDVGCGEGTITHMMAELLSQAQVTGIDFSKTGIQCAAERYRRTNLRFLHDETSQELGNRYDLVTAFEVIEHVEDWPELLGRIAAAARQFVLLSFPTGRMRSFERSLGHYRNFSVGEVEQFMAQRDYEPVAISYAGFPFFSPLYRELCNITQSGGAAFVTGSYGWDKKLLSSMIYCSFRFASTRRRFGDQFCGLFRRKTE